MVAESIELLIAAVFAVHDESLMLGYVLVFAQVFKNRRLFLFEPFTEKFLSYVLVLFILAGNDIERALAMAGIDADHRGKRIDEHLREERPAFEEVMAKKRGVGRFRRDGLATPGSAAETNNNEIRSSVGRPLGPPELRQRRSQRRATVDDHSASSGEHSLKEHAAWQISGRII